jgi:Ig domain of plant-specific actin-binding protein
MKETLRVPVQRAAAIERPVLVGVLAAIGTLLMLIAVAAGFSGLGYAAPNQTAAMAQYAPQNTSPPTISGQAVEGQTLTATTGSWTGDQPINFAFQWQRCDRSGLNCANIAGATSSSYTLTPADVGNTIRVAVTAQNASGSSTAFSAPTAPVQSAGPAGQIPLPGGGISIPVTSVSLPVRLIIDRVVFSPNPIRSRTNPFTIRVRVKDTRNFFVRGALVFARPTPLVSTAPPESATGQDGWVTLRSTPRRVRGLVFPLQRGLNVQFYVQARKPGERLQFGPTGTRLVQVATAPPR